MHDQFARAWLKQAGWLVGQVAERTITADLEGLIVKAVDSKAADYAVVTGIQIHNWAADFHDQTPTLEFVLPGTIYAVVNGQPKYGP